MDSRRNHDLVTIEPLFSGPIFDRVLYAGLLMAMGAMKASTLREEVAQKGKGGPNQNAENKGGSVRRELSVGSQPRDGYDDHRDNDAGHDEHAPAGDFGSGEIVFELPLQESEGALNASAERLPQVGILPKHRRPGILRRFWYWLW